MSTKPDKYAVRYRDPIATRAEGWNYFSKMYDKKSDAVKRAQGVQYYRTQVIKVRWDEDYGSYVPYES